MSNQHRKEYFKEFFKAYLEIPGNLEKHRAYMKQYQRTKRLEEAGKPNAEEIREYHRLRQREYRKRKKFEKEFISKQPVQKEPVSKLEKNESEKLYHVSKLLINRK